MSTEQRLGGRPKKTVLILSTGRSGTRAVAHYLQTAFYGATALHEPKPSRHLRIASFKYLAGRCTQEHMVELLSDARRKLYARVQDTVYIESNPFLTGFLEVLPRVFHRPKVIHLVRDPRTMVRSAINFGANRGIKRLVSALLPYWVLKPEMVLENPERKWAQMSPVERFAWSWRVSNQHLNRGAELYGEDYLRIHYEHLFLRGGQGIRSITSWIGLKERPGVLQRELTERINASTRHDQPLWDQWTDEERRILLHHCGELMKQYGYLR